MKQIIVGLLLSIYLLGSTQVGQLVKIPFLVQHYLEHKAENAGISLLTFLRIHYNEKKEKDSDYEKDMQLPFKVIDNSTLTLVNNLPPQKMEFKVKPTVDDYTFHTPYHPVFTAQTACGDIFQPPRLA